MENNEDKLIHVDMTVQDVAALASVLQLTKTLMLAANLPLEFMVEVTETIKPLVEKVLEKAQAKCDTLNKKSAIDGLNIRFTDKQSPKDKPNA
jgi:hypothetical protein